MAMKMDFGILPCGEMKNLTQVVLVVMVVSLVEFG